MLLQLLFALGSIIYAQSICEKPRPFTIVLPEDLEVKLRFGETVTSRTALIDDPVSFLLDEDISDGHETVARLGEVAAGFVANCRKAEMLGQGGELSVRVDYVKVRGMKVRVIGAYHRMGEDKVASSVVLTALFGPVGLMKRGKDAEIRKGTPVVVRLAHSVQVSLSPP